MFERTLVGVLFTVCALSQAAAGTKPVVLDAAFITGSTTYSVEQLAAVTAVRMGQPISQQLLAQISADVQSLYRRDGYVAPAVALVDFVPTSSTPRLHVFEASLAEVEVRGDVGPYATTIARRVAELRTGVLHKQRTAQQLSAIEALPGVHVRATFEPRADTRNSYVLVLNLTYAPVQATFDVHNRGSDDVGPLLISGRVTLNGLLGLQEGLSVTGASSGDGDEYRHVSARIERGFDRVAMALSASTSNAEPASNFDYSTQRIRFESVFVAHDDGAVRIEPLLAFRLRDSEADDEAGAVSRVRTRVAEAGMIARTSSRSTHTYLTSSVSRGFDSLGAESFNRYGTPVQLDFTKAQIDVMHVHAFAPQWHWRADVEGQWSRDDLPAGERYTFGGARFGRGFDPATLIADSGASLSLQIERALPWAGKLVQRLRVFAQGDYGYARDNRRAADDAASVSLGIGARVASVLTSLEVSESLVDPAHSRWEEGARAFIHMRAAF